MGGLHRLAVEAWVCWAGIPEGKKPKATFKPMAGFGRLYEPLFKARKFIENFLMFTYFFMSKPPQYLFT